MGNNHLSIDIETRSSVDIKKAGAYKYAQSPDFEILLFAYQWDDNPVEVIDLKTGERLPGCYHKHYDEPILSKPPITEG